MVRMVWFREVQCGCEHRWFPVDAATRDLTPRIWQVGNLSAIISEDEK